MTNMNIHYSIMDVHNWNADMHICAYTIVDLFTHFWLPYEWWVVYVNVRYDKQFNSSPPDKMAATFADDILKCIFLNENIRISI